jgi:hypothetical protein
VRREVLRLYTLVGAAKTHEEYSEVEEPALYE